MISKSRQRLKYIVTDLITANAAILVFDILRFYTLPNIGYFSLQAFLSSNVLLSEQLLLPILMVCVYAIGGYYNEPYQRSRIQEFITTALTQIANTLFIYFALLANQATSVRATNILMLVGLYMLLLVTTYLGRSIVTSTTLSRFKKGKKIYSVMVAGRADVAVPVATQLAEHTPRTGMSFGGYIRTSSSAEDSYPVDAQVYDISTLYEHKDKLEFQEIILAGGGSDEAETLQWLNLLIPLNVPIKVLPESVSALSSNIRLQSIYEEPYIDASTANVSEFTKNAKRLIDILISTLALILLSLPMCIIALMVKRSSPGPAFFKQERIGYRRRPFMIYKFRTMRIDAEADGPRLSCEEDPRVTRLGAVLRKYRIDELPQFWNVLKGDMSLVGPRPERTFFIKQIMERNPSYTLVHLVRPGITSWGMVKYGYASNVDEMLRRLKYDLIYISNMSVAVDIKILIYTLKTVIKGRGM